ncbi:MAG: DUF3054 domain-containing protein [Halobacteriales archaeon]
MNVGVAALRGTEPDARTLGVAAGDAVVVVAVLTAGMYRHQVDPLAAPGHAALVIAPFLVGWTLAAPPAGAYARDSLDSPRLTVATGVAAWVPAALGGAAIRATPPLPGNAPPTFVAVVLGFGGLGITAWRAVVAWS